MRSYVTISDSNEFRSTRGLLLPLFTYLTWLYWPATRGGFVADDYVFIATSRMVEQPLAAFWQSHFYEPIYFRPIGQLSWWLANYFFELNYSVHSLINLILHGLNSLLLFQVLRALALPMASVWLGMILFTLAPPALATAMWPSNRFDLLAVFFLLLQAWAMLRALHSDTVRDEFFVLRKKALPWHWLGLSALAALAACWSKELSYLVAPVMAVLPLMGKTVNKAIARALLISLGLSIAVAFFWRHYLVAQAYGVLGQNPWQSVVNGVIALLVGLPRWLLRLVTSPDASESVHGFKVWALGLTCFSFLLLVLCFLVLRTSSQRRLLLAALSLLLAVSLVQTPLAGVFIGSLDWGVFGVISFARFYYAPTLAFAVVVAILWTGLTQWRLFATWLVLGLYLGLSLWIRPLGAEFTNWVKAEIEPVSIAATRLADEGEYSPCLNVILGAQDYTPLFRMFSDVTVKARSQNPKRSWQCLTMTESTPWLFIAPISMPWWSNGLIAVPSVNDSDKPDSTWSGVRYRYRLPPESFAQLPDARFYLWSGGRLEMFTPLSLSGDWLIKPNRW